MWATATAARSRVGPMTARRVAARYTSTIPSPVGRQPRITGAAQGQVGHPVDPAMAAAMAEACSAAIWRPSAS